MEMKKIDIATSKRHDADRPPLEESARLDDLTRGHLVTDGGMQTSYSAAYRVNALLLQ